jgi:hypothetical protein
MNHCSTNNDILWYVDEISPRGESMYYVKGWIFNRFHQIEKIRLRGNHFTDYTPYFRSDVQEIYPENRFLDNTGFELLITKEQIDVPVEVVFGDGNYVVIESLKKFFVHHSGFNVGHKNLMVIDNFYKDPDFIREYAINNLKFNESDYHRGKRSDRFLLNGTKEKLEEILGRTITNWNHPSYANGIFQYCTSYDPIVYHIDSQTFAGAIFLTPNAPLDSGTATYRSKITGATRFEEFNDEYSKTFLGVSNDFNFYDNTSFELVDKVANVYNRLVMWDAKTIHAASNYFGDDINNARFFQLFFFDVE